MVRPIKCRRIGCNPKAVFFKPAGVPARQLKELVLTVDELESIRLADFDSLYQEQAAEEMNISRQTFANILRSAHKKIADGLLNGKVIRIEGGVYMIQSTRSFICSKCNHTWQVEYGIQRPAECPQCGNKNIHRSPSEREYAKIASGQGRKRCGRSAL
ncbi:DUF134 domain-containing protein [Chloroflexota bacterium]